ncbi:2-oxoacid:ferredoxin oxidoreductase subunit beta [Candidatus Woesearchaeota archaeon]|nr:2-oxoacid:ferredoxin oxidoreductase subunit beta [Candidatus Woesearchaeota archaeon]
MINLRTERLPTPWCVGCGLNTMLIQTASLLNKLGYNKTNTAVFSGIGCTARASGFFDIDGVNGLHGRAIPLAEGCKLANPDLKVIVISGDGDLTGIGGNHLLHSARRNTDITVICSANEIYGMTGGQVSPLTKKGTKTLTTPKGSEYEPLNLFGLFTSNKKHFYARTSVAHGVHMVRCIEEALKHKGFSFVEILNPCYTSLGARIGFNSFKEMLDDIKEKYTITENKDKLGDYELGIIKR